MASYALDRSMDMELKVFLLALNQLGERKEEEERVIRSNERMAKKSSQSLKDLDRDKYDRVYGSIEQFIRKTLSKRWGMELIG